MNKRRLLIVSAGKYPVPAVKGGAVETLTEQLIDLNEIHKDYQVFLLENYDEIAKTKETEYRETRFLFYPTNLLFRVRAFFIKIVNRIFKTFIKTPRDLYLLKQIREYNIDAVLLESTMREASIIKKNFPQVRVYLHVHNIPSIDTTRLIASSIDKFLCISKFIAQKVSSNLFAESSKIAILYNCVDTNQFCPVSKEEKVALRKQLNIAVDDFVFVFVGRLQPCKGVRELLQAFSLARQHCGKMKLLVVGSSFFENSPDNEYTKQLKKIAKDLYEHIVFTGFVSHSSVQRCFQVADVATVPSMWEEPFGLTCAEALACGVPVIATKSGGIPEIVDDMCSFQVEISDSVVCDLVNAMCWFYNNPYKLEQMKIASREKSMQFSIDRYWRTFVRLLTENR